MDPAALAAMLGQQGPPGAASLHPPQADDPGDATDPLGALQDAIHAATTAMVALPDPQDVQDVAGALQVLARVQTRLMKSNAPAQG